jgi:hypothetical protein
MQADFFTVSSIGANILPANDARGKMQDSGFFLRFFRLGIDAQQRTVIQIMFPAKFSQS